MLSTIMNWSLITGTVSLAVMATIFVVVMRKTSGGTQITGWRKKAFHPAPYLRVTGISYAIAAGAFLLNMMVN